MAGGFGGLVLAALIVAPYGGDDPPQPLNAIALSGFAFGSVGILFGVATHVRCFRNRRQLSAGQWRIGDVRFRHTPFNNNMSAVVFVDEQWNEAFFLSGTTFTQRKNAEFDGALLWVGSGRRRTISPPDRRYVRSVYRSRLRRAGRKAFEFVMDRDLDETPVRHRASRGPR